MAVVGLQLLAMGCLLVAAQSTWHPECRLGRARPAANAPGWGGLAPPGLQACMGFDADRRAQHPAHTPPGLGPPADNTSTATSVATSSSEYASEAASASSSAVGTAISQACGDQGATSAATALSSTVAQAAAAATAKAQAQVTLALGSTLKLQGLDCGLRAAGCGLSRPGQGSPHPGCPQTLAPRLPPPTHLPAPTGVCHGLRAGLRRCQRHLQRCGNRHRPGGGVRLCFCQRRLRRGGGGGRCQHLCQPDRDRHRHCRLPGVLHR